MAVGPRKNADARLPRGTVSVLLVGWAIASVLAQPAPAQLRVVCWNTHTDGGYLNAGTSTVLEAIGNESVNGIAKAPDILVLQEQSYGYSSANAFVAAMDALYGPGTYARADQHPYDYSMPVNVVYNTTTVALEDTYYFKYSTSPRATGRYRFGIVGYGDGADLYVYNTHYKAGSDTSDQQKRFKEAWTVRFNADGLPADTSIIYAGDFNQYTSYEDAYHEYPTLTENPYMCIKAATMPPGSSGNGVGADPINVWGIWHEGVGYVHVHTQAPGSTFTGGGMDDRFDFQMVSMELMDGEGLSYIAPGIGDCPAATASYRPFGNNGTHNLNQDISTGTGHPDPNVLDALETASDHLPVVVDYQVPAKMSVEVDDAPEILIVGASADVDVTVWNSADVVAAVGADELDYSLSATGDLSGSAIGTDAALGGENTHQVSLVTTTVGARSGQVGVTSSSQAVADGTFSEGVSFSVYDHAEASFQSGGNQDTLDIAFGSIRQGRTAGAEPFAVHNLVSTPNYTADLDIDAVNGSGDTAVLTTDLAPTSGIAPGSSQSASAALDTTNPGSFSATYTVSVSDMDEPGAASGDDLTLNLSATVVLLGDVDGDGDGDANDIDADDIDTLRSRFGTSDPFADLDDSGTVDQADLDMLVRTILGTQYGDINLDGRVDEDDYDAYAPNYGQSGGWAAGDLNGDGVVTGADYTIYAANHGFGVSGGAP